MDKGFCKKCGKETSQIDGRNGDFICRDPCYWQRRQSENRAMARKYDLKYKSNYIDQYLKESL